MITRKEYLEGEFSHAEYYAEIVASVPLHSFPYQLADRCRAALVAGDEHLNTIPLAEWDAYGRRLGLPHSPSLKANLRERGDFISDAGIVCILKSWARSQVSGGYGG